MTAPDQYHWKLASVTNIDWTECTLTETVPGKMSGTPVLRGTRVRPDDLLVNRDEGIDWLVENFDIPADIIRRLFAFHDQHQAARAPHPA